MTQTIARFHALKNATSFLRTSVFRLPAGKLRFANYRRCRLERLEARLAFSANAAHLLKDVAAGPASSEPRDFALSNGGIYFLADASAQSSGLWSTDGNNQTTLIHQSASTGEIQLQGLYDFEDQLVFLQSELPLGAGGYSLQMWTSDGTAQSTSLVRSFGNKSGQYTALPDVAFDPYFASAPGHLFMSIDGRDSKGRELWTSDLTSAGTTLLRDINVGADSSIPNNWIEFEGRIYFSAESSQYGEELWSSDGSSTTIVQDFMPGPQGSYPSGMLVADGSLFFATHDLGTDGIYSSDDHMKWWRLDDFNIGPLLIHDFGPGSGTSLIKTQLAYFKGELYGVAQDLTHGVELWKTDDSQTGVSIVMDLNPNGDSLPWQPTATYDALYFAADDGENGEELWKTDGTPNGTVMVRDLFTGSDSSIPRSLVAKGGELFFSADDGSGRSLWQSDGTLEGTLRVSLKNNVNGIAPEDLVILDSHLFYSASTDTTGREPWAAKISSWNAAYVPNDVNRDSNTTPLDALIIINEINNRVFSNPDTGQLPNDRPNLPNAYRFDVNADGYATPLDPLIIINWLNREASSLGEGETSVDPMSPPAIINDFSAASTRESLDTLLPRGAITQVATWASAPVSLETTALEIKSVFLAPIDYSADDLTPNQTILLADAATDSLLRPSTISHAPPILLRELDASRPRQEVIDQIFASDDYLES